MSNPTTNRRATTGISRLLSVDKLLFLQNLAEQQLDWISASALANQMWKLLMLATDPGKDHKTDPIEASDMAYMYARLCEFFEQLEMLRPGFDELGERVEEDLGE